MQDRDYPFYDGEPVEITARQWLVPIIGVGIATWILLSRFAIFDDGLLQLVPAILLAGAPLIGLALVAGRHWTALFHKVHLKDVGWMFGFALLNYAIAVPLGLLSMQFIESAPNAGISGMAEADTSFQVLFFVNSIPQLIGEELISIIPFLAIIYFLTQKAGMGRTPAVVIAWLATAVWFAAIHLPTYNWNILQCLILIGGARLVLTLAYIKTKNLWVSAGAHIINDWATFTLALIAAGVAT